MKSRLLSLLSILTSTLTSTAASVSKTSVHQAPLYQASLNPLQQNIKAFSSAATKMSSFYLEGTPDSVKNATGIHLITLSTPNGQKVQILLEELKALYPDFKYETTLVDIMTNDQKKDWFLKLNPNGRIPVLVDNNHKPEPFCVMETSAELLYLLKEVDKNDEFGFKDEFERNQCLQWLFFWHGSGAPYQGNLGFFKRAQEQVPSMSLPLLRQPMLTIV